MDEKTHKTFFHHWIAAYADRLHLVKQGTDDRIEMPASTDSAPSLLVKDTSKRDRTDA